MTGAVRYTQSDGLDIAYRVFGDGPRDVVVFPALISHLELVEEIAYWRALIEQLAGRARLVMFDRRGAGLSDRRRVGTPEERMDDLRAVLDAVGSERATILGVGDSGPQALLFAATYPERTAALVLHGTTARFLDDPDDGYDVGIPMDELGAIVELNDVNWTTGATVAAVFGVTDESKLPTFARWERNIANPSLARELLHSFFVTDVRPVLPLIACPTFVLHHTFDTAIPVACGRYLASAIPGAEYTELPFHSNTGSGADADVAVEHIVRFVVGADAPAATNRVLATVLFTDIVDSTASALASGDGSWRRVLDRFERRAGELVEAGGGRVIKTTGDGVLAMFDGPGRAVRAGHSLVSAAAVDDLDIRVGLHTGEVELRGDDIGGIAVHLASRIQSQATAGEVLVSRTVVDLTVGSDLRFDARGPAKLKGFDAPWELYASVSG